MSESEMKATANGTKANGNNLFGMPLPDFSKMALPGIAGSEQVLARTREGFEKIKAASEEMTETLCQTYSGNARSATDYGLKVFELSSANAASTLDFMIDLCGSKSATDVVALSAEQTRKAFVAASDQNRELWALAQKLATETGEPIRKHFNKVFHQTG
ncbi:phasin family protein [Bradyrhizobium sp. BWA-3-5]|uniref:phasin family protein n=1 Tax=Bradyrhizobium sp. BWA-3-5 TaxID=3080013 RepID=UPI00293F1221|nr:phasin family protein [Bradyrhizobium sp. BWA-3-5]WOH68831.1 phasin family protein [Bradyrhizobium sp. BWA-3-5]